MDNTLTLKDVQKRLAEIKAIAGDDEAAHCREDDLHQDILRAIAEDRCDNPKACAAEALKSQDIDFARWCA